MKKTYSLLFLIVVATASVCGQPKSFSISKEDLKDKIMGGWAGQTIGVTFGSPMEFHYNGTIIDAYQPIPWYDGYLKKLMTESPGIYVTLYMDLTFVEVLSKEGLDAPRQSLPLPLQMLDIYYGILIKLPGIIFYIVSFPDP